MQPGDARSGRFVDNLAGFGRALRRAGVPVDGARIARAVEAALGVGLARREDVSAALEAVMISREQDRLVFRELFEAWFREPQKVSPLPAQTMSGAGDTDRDDRRRPRVREALAPHGSPGPRPRPAAEREPDSDAAMTASELARLRRADFNGLSASEYQRVERLARDIRLPMPDHASRRFTPGSRGARLHWPRAMHQAARTGGEWMLLPRLQRRNEPLPLLVLVDVSGSMERYARLLLAFLHASTRGLRRRDLFAFGTDLTDLTPAMRLADTDQMLAQAGRVIQDFAGGTRLGASLAQLRRRFAHRLVGRRTLVLLISDGLDTGEPAELGRELDWLRAHCHRLLWLNPLLRFDGYAPLARGATQLHRHAHGMLAVHNLEKLEDLASGIAAVLRR